MTITRPQGPEKPDGRTRLQGLRAAAAAASGSIVWALSDNAGLGLAVANLVWSVLEPRRDASS